jgi:hypothetical protein
MDYFRDKIMIFLSSTWGKLQSHDSLVPWLVLGLIIVVALTVRGLWLPTVSNRNN